MKEKGKLMQKLFLLTVLLSFVGLTEASAAIFQVDADVNSISPIYYDAFSTPSYYPLPLDTGLYLNPGDMLEISASGTWSNAPVSYNLIFGPNGNPNENIAAGYPGASYPVAALMGKIGNNSYFFIGTNYSNQISQSGTLCLGFNDTDYGNNWGVVTADITHSAIPEPSSMLLLTFTGLVFGIFKRKR